MKDMVLPVRFSEERIRELINYWFELDSSKNPPTRDPEAKAAYNKIAAWVEDVKLDQEKWFELEELVNEFGSCRFNWGFVEGFRFAGMLINGDDTDEDEDDNTTPHRETA